MDKTNNFISANPVEAATIIAKELKVDPKPMEVVLDQTKHEMTADETFVKDLDAQANLLFKQGRFGTKPPAGLSGWLDFSTLKQAFPAYVKVQ